MKISVKNESLAGIGTEAVLLPFFEDEKDWGAVAKALDKQSRGLIKAFFKTGDFQGKLFQTGLIYTHDVMKPRRILLIGMGKKKDFNVEKLRGVYARGAQWIRSANLKSFASALDEAYLALPFDEAAEAVVEGVQLGLYQFTAFKTVDRDSIKDIDEFVICEEAKNSYAVLQKSVKTAEIICRAVQFARDIVSMPANKMTPTDIAREAVHMAKDRKSLAVSVLDAARMKKMGMNALLGVAQGSDQPPKFIILEYNGAGKSAKPIVLVGKGITFDSGGISLKPAEKMDEMKTDMAGAAAVLGAIRVAADLKLRLRIVGLIPATENLPSGKSLKPGDILKSMSGITIEVLNTDAEGRLILADALAYAGRYKPQAILDIATLTGACVVALGEQTIGMLGNDDALKNRVRQAAEKTGERVWEMPLWEEYHDLIKSDIADYKNSSGRNAGTITAAAFLSKFAGDYPWVHLDIAGPAWTTKDRPYIPKGASGVGVRLFTDFLRHWQEA